MNVFLNVLFDSVSLKYGQHHHHHIDETVEYLLPHLQPYRPNSISLMPAPQARRLGLIGMYVCMYVCTCNVSNNNNKDKAETKFQGPPLGYCKCAKVVTHRKISLGMSKVGAKSGVGFQKAQMQ